MYRGERREKEAQETLTAIVEAELQEYEGDLRVGRAAGSLQKEPSRRARSSKKTAKEAADLFIKSRKGTAANKIKKCCLLQLYQSQCHSLLPHGSLCSCYCCGLLWPQGPTAAAGAVLLYARSDVHMLPVMQRE